jgi:ribonucleoside-diphosphate reductase alpha chain
MEIALPTQPLDNINDESGEIALCTLSGINLGEINQLEDIKEPAELIVRALDALLDYQDYPVIAAKNGSMKRRTLGIGVINYAYYLAKNGTKYSDPTALGLTHRTFEALQYYLLVASNKLAKEQGACPAFDDTTYSQGVLPIDTYKVDIDAICNEPLQLDWEALRHDIKTHGLRNSTLTALMPSETSSQIANATNGIEPPRGLVSVKASKDGILKQVVPEIDRLKDQYELLWQMPNNKGYLSLVAIMQKFIDQSISANTNYDPTKFEDSRVPMKVMIQDLLMAYKLGVKTLYYHNTRDGANDAQDDLENGCAGGACTL